MTKITALKMQKRNKERVNLFLDGSFVFGIPLNDALSLKVGDELRPEQVERLRHLGELDKAKDSALRLLAFRPRSSAEIKRHLRDKGYDDHEIEHVVGRLTDLKFVDDRTFAQYWVEQRERFKPRSAFVLRQELRQKGIGDELIEEALDNLDDTASARKAADQRVQRWRHLPEADFKKKLGAYLQRRGFRYGVVRDVLDALWAELESENALNSAP